MKQTKLKYYEVTIAHHFLFFSPSYETIIVEAKNPLEAKKMGEEKILDDGMEGREDVQGVRLIES